MKPPHTPHDPSYHGTSASAFTGSPARDEPPAFDPRPSALSLVITPTTGTDIDTDTAPWLEDFVIEVRHTGSRWRIAENGASVCAFVDLEDALPLALAYAQARGDAGGDASVYLKTVAAPRMRVARYGPATMVDGAVQVSGHSAVVERRQTRSGGNLDLSSGLLPQMGDRR